jgi:hypothetical protein
MNALYRYVFTVAALAMSAQAAAQITFYEHQSFRGASVTLDRPVGDLRRYNFSGAASSAVVAGEMWEVCEGVGFTGRCEVLQPGSHSALRSMNDSISSARPVSARGPSSGYPGQPGYPQQPGYPPQPGYQPQPGTQVTFYERRDFGGRAFGANGPIPSFPAEAFNDRASSVVVSGGSWEVCDSPHFSGRCAVLRPGQYPSLNEIGLNNAISSARPVGDARPHPQQGGGQVTLYEHANLRGQSITLDRARRNFERFGFNNSASSAVVIGEPWELCEGPGFSGRCVVLRPGRYNSLGSTGLNDNVSSARPAQR